MADRDHAIKEAMKRHKASLAAGEQVVSAVAPPAPKIGGDLPRGDEGDGATALDAAAAAPTTTTDGARSMMKSSARADALAAAKQAMKDRRANESAEQVPVVPPAAVAATAEEAARPRNTSARTDELAAVKQAINESAEQAVNGSTTATTTTGAFRVSNSGATSEVAAPNKDDCESKTFITMKKTHRR